MATPGYECSLSLSGTSTAFTTEAFTDLGAGDAWQITSAAKRVWNANTIPNFFDNAVAIPTGDIESIDYLFGIVTFTGVKVGPITATGAYFPRHAITSGYEFSLDVSRNLADVTVFGDTSHRRFPLLLDASGEISVYDTVDTDYDAGGGSLTFKGLLDNGTQVVITMALNSGNTILYRALAIITGFDLKASVDGIEEGSVQWTASPRVDAAGRPVHFSYREA